MMIMEWKMKKILMMKMKMINPKNPKKRPIKNLLILPNLEVIKKTVKNPNVNNNEKGVF